jgi:hypothetical protein
MMLNIERFSFIYGIRILALALILLIKTISSTAQRSEPPPIKERLFYGGSLGLQFGTITDIQISPVIGFWVLPRLAIAAGPTYRFYKSPFFKTDIYGGRAYTQFVIIQDLSSIIPIGSRTGIFLHGENELLSLESEAWKNPPYDSDRFNLNTFLAGFGLSQQMGRRSSFNIMILWALNESYYDIYSNPEIRISFTF